ncbi:MAG TPA: phospholipase D-like domain-containing protein, partial [Armatimonadota bacterium]|nr:phospholipase D-like domain-containing protein [Armatimonadota bacterium]
MESQVEDITISIGNQFVADNDRFKMREALDHMVDSAHLDVCTAFLDAYGVAAIGSAAESGELRLLVGFDLSDIPVAQDIVSFQMAEEWKASGEDPVHRVADEESVSSAVKALQLPTFQVAKAALRTHSKLYVTEDIGIVGSSNLTRSGIEGQRELNLFQHEPDAIARLREWFASMWSEAKQQERADFKEELIKWLETTRLKRFAPFHPYAKAIFERYRHRFVSLAPSASDINLAVFQEEGRDTALSVLAEIKCCIIADAVGLGKTYVALGAMQRRSKARPRNQRKILVICPAQLEPVWERASRDQGIALITESMETLGNTSGSKSDARLRDLENYALVIVDEAHNFRNPNSNRFQNLMEVLQGGPQDKEVLLLTATPINNSIRDLYSLYRLMTRDRDDFFATTNLGIRSLREFFKQVEKMRISTIDLLLETMVCRSRLDIRRRQEDGEIIVINDKEVRFPKR